MSMHCGYCVKVDNLRPHTNADRLQIATFFGNDTCVGLDVVKGEIGVYFPSDLQLSEEFCMANHLCRKKPDGTPDTGYLDPEKRNIRPIKLRGERSDGIFLSICCLEYTGVNLDDINIGDTITVVNGHEICKKYIPRGRNRNNEAKGKGNKTRKKHAPVAPLFTEHADTEQLAYNLDAFKPGDEIEITLKMHGTSQRTAYVPVLKGYKRTIWDKIFKREGTPIYDWDYVSGTRRTVLDDWDGGFYGSNAFRKQHHDKFVGKLLKGEEVYYEITSYTDNGTPIMSNCSVPKEYQNIYGDTMEFSYGCSPNGLGEPVEYWDEAKTRPAIYPKVPRSDLYVYRMTMTNEDGDVVEYSPDFMRYRCEQMGVKCVPMLWRGFIPADESLKEGYNCNGEYGTWRVCREGTPGEWIKNIAEQYYDGPDPIGKTHVREGVVVRIINRPKFCAYKHKNFLFKLITGIIVDKIADSNENINEDILEEL